MSDRYAERGGEWRPTGQRITLDERAKLESLGSSESATREFSRLCRVRGLVGGEYALDACNMTRIMVRRQHSGGGAT